jgi:GAF domain/ANTAR domain
MSQTYIGRAPAEFVRIQEFTTAAVDVFGVDGAALTIIGSAGGRVLVHASDVLSFELDELQFSLGEGPCIDAKNTAQPVLVESLRAADAQARWPGFARDAVMLDAGAEFAFPLLAEGRPFAVLQTYRHEAGRLSRQQLALGERLLDASRDLLLDELDQHLSRRPADLSLGVHDRSHVHQATGMLAAELGISVEEALVRLRAAAYAQGVPVSGFARDVVAGTHTFGPASI